MQLTELFNLKIQEFMDDLIATYPEETDFQAMKNMLDWTIKFMGVNVPQEMFYSCVVLPYGDKIIAKHEGFFLEECVYDNQYADINIINKLKNKWVTLNEDNKEVIWKYLHVLNTLSTKIEKAKRI